MVAALSLTRKVNADRTYAYKVDIKQNIIRLDTGITLNFMGLSIPLALKDVKQFEKANPEISVNVFGYERDSIEGPYYLKKEEKRHHVKLILLNEWDKFHYIWIKNMSRLLSSQLSAHEHAAYICNGCVQHFHREKDLDVHKKQCGGVVCSMSKTKKDAILKSGNYKKMQMVGISIYADAESVRNVDGDPNNSGKTEKVKEHIPCAFSYNIKCSFNINTRRRITI
ncbi:uncharacterized protein [Musca autumnalis]|uniref:uncharacterized protein n=1 Tax=Musca autumnalis TaxID=221902 RepID=UPI003CF33FF3